MKSRNLRIGIVSFLNASPLTHYLSNYLPGSTIISDVPSQLEKKLIHNQIDIALLSSISYAQLYPNFNLIPKMGIISKGPVKSVNLFINPSIIDKLEGKLSIPDKKKSMEIFPDNTTAKMVKIISLDPASKTSNSMLKILFNASFPKISPKFILPETKMPVEDRIQNFDCTLVIGDDAMIQAQKNHYLDLGRWWMNEFNLPFVYALWLVSSTIKEKTVESSLLESLELGLNNKAHLPNLPEYQKLNRFLSAPELLLYLTENIHYHLGPKELLGLKLYYSKLKELNIIENIPPLPL